MELERFTLGSLRKAVFDGDTENGSLMAGQAAGLLHEVRPVEEIFAAMVSDAKTASTGCTRRSPYETSILYAGQGSQHAGMGQDLYEAFPAFRAAFDEAAAAVDFDLKEVCFTDTTGVLNETQYTQPCMTAFAAGLTAVLREAGVTPDYAAGLSLGEYSALACAGCLMCGRRLP